MSDWLGRLETEWSEEISFVLASDEECIHTPVSEKCKKNRKLEFIASDWKNSLVY